MCYLQTGYLEKKLSHGFLGRISWRRNDAIGISFEGRVTRDRCYDFLNIFAEKFIEKIGVFDSKQS
jgi:hypothetical protein